jgi:hypothetical protein
MQMPHRPELHESGTIDPDLIASLVKAGSGLAARCPKSGKM